MVVRITVFAVDLLSPHHVSSDAVGVAFLVFTFANLNYFGVYSQKLKVLSLIDVISLKVFQKRWQKLIRQSQNHVI